MGVNLNWFKSYGLRCSKRPCECSVNSKNVATDKWPFYDHVWPFFAKYMVIFHKTDIQTVILRCLTSLNLNWYKSYKIQDESSIDIVFENILTADDTDELNRKTTVLSKGKFELEYQKASKLQLHTNYK